MFFSTRANRSQTRWKTGHRRGRSDPARRRGQALPGRRSHRQPAHHHGEEEALPDELGALGGPRDSRREASPRSRRGPRDGIGRWLCGLRPSLPMGLPTAKRRTGGSRLRSCPTSRSFPSSPTFGLRRRRARSVTRRDSWEAATPTNFGESLASKEGPRRRTGRRVAEAIGTTPRNAAWPRCSFFSSSSHSPAPGGWSSASSWPTQGSRTA